MRLPAPSDGREAVGSGGLRLPLQQPALFEEALDYEDTAVKLLVTGGAGFIGSHLVRACLNRPDVWVVNLDKLTYAGNLDSIRDLRGHPRHEFIQADIADAAALREVFSRHQPDAVLHLAAESHVDRSIDAPDEFIRTNIAGTYNLLEASHRLWQERKKAGGNFRYLQVSTDEVYGSLGFGDSAFAETTAYDPHSPYAASKAAADHLARAWYHTYGLPVLVTHSPNNYGPNQFPEKLIPLVIIKALQGEEIPVYGRGENIRDWLHVTDHVSAVLAVLERGRVGETYHVGGGQELSNLDLVRRLCVVLGELRPRADGQSYAGQIRLVTDRPGHDLRYAINAAKIRSELGWQPQETLATGLRQTVQWYLDNEAWWRPILSGKYQLQRLGVTSAAIP